MPLSAEENATAKKAYGEMRACNGCRMMSTVGSGIILCSILLFGIFIQCGMVVIDDKGNYLKGWQAFLSFFLFSSKGLIFVFVPILIQARTYFRLKPRYQKNQDLVTALEKKYQGEYPYGLEREVLNVHPLLETWLLRLEKRPLLWRLDAFLSRKSVPK